MDNFYREAYSTAMHCRKGVLEIIRVFRTIPSAAEELDHFEVEFESAFVNFLDKPTPDTLICLQWVWNRYVPVFNRLVAISREKPLIKDE